MLTPRNIEWIAAFLEGEGCFLWSRGKRGSGSLVVTASQKQRWPLEKLQNLCGGSLYKEGHLDINRWSVSGPTAASVMMTIYALMSPWRQQQMKKALDPWKARKPQRLYNLHCKRGHPMNTENTRTTLKGHRLCRACVYQKNLDSRAKRRRFAMVRDWT